MKLTSKSRKFIEEFLAIGEDFKTLTSPTQISDLGAWWDASQLGLANGAAVASWTDMSGQARHAAQATGTKQPLFVTNALNGLPVVRFDGVDDGLILAAGTPRDIARNVPGLTVFAVVRDALAGAAGTRRIFMASTNALTSAVRIALNAVSTGWQTNARRADADGQATLSAPSVVNPLTYNIVSNTFDFGARTVFVRQNGAILGTQTDFTSVGATTDDTASAGVGVGAHGSAGGTYWGGDIAELIVYRRGLTTTERQRVQRYLSKKWGISLT